MQQTLGQYFTTSLLLQEKIYSLIINKPKVILEPCVGRGDLVKYIKQHKNRLNFDSYEIDNTLQFVIDPKDIIFCDFLTQHIKKKYTTIIGNPPYVKTTKGNLYIEFIKKCYELLKKKGELIFIVPSDFFKLTCASTLLDIMFNNGNFTHVFHPNNEKLFEGASIDIMIFRYCKDKTLEKKTFYNNKLMYTHNNTGLLIFSENENNNILMFKDYFDVYVGLVSGNDSIFQNDNLGNVSLLVDKNLIKKYILVDQFPTSNEEVNTYLSLHKNKLLERKTIKFNESNWFKWGTRNNKCMENNKGIPCIYIRTITRKTEIAFKSTVTYFGAKLLMMIPKNDRVNLDKIVTYLNSPEFKQNFIYSGRFRIGHSQLSKHIINDDMINK